MPRGKRSNPRDHSLALPDLTPLLTDSHEVSYLRDLVLNAQSRAFKFKPMTVPERFESFQRLGYRPYGLYLPDDLDWRDETLKRQRAIGDQYPDPTQEGPRLRAYYKLQDETLTWAARPRPVPGRYTGTLAVAQSPATFRIVAFGRRAGKSFHSAHEALGTALIRPGSTIWVAAPIHRLVGRVFDEIYRVVHARQLKTRSERNTVNERRIVLENGSVIEGVSLDDILRVAGAAVDFVVLDEAAQLTADTWHRGIQPPLTDRNGQALIISSWEGDEGFFASQVQLAQDRKSDAWAYFHGVSWDNFYIAPQGEDSPIFRERKATTPPLDYLEQYGAIPKRAQQLIYPEFKSSIHMGHTRDQYAYQPGHKVILSVDPAKGANEYAFVAIQDYGEFTHVIDEWYVRGAMCEDAHQAAKARPYFTDIRDVVMDSADPNEIERWVRAGFDAYGVRDKPQPKDRFPIYRALLRDPYRYSRLYQSKVEDWCAENGYDALDFEKLGIEVRYQAILEIESSFSPDRITPADTEALARCARIFFHMSCTFTEAEHKSYAYEKPHHSTVNPSEKPRMYKDHLMDCLGYFAWEYKRWDIPDLSQPKSYLTQDKWNVHLPNSHTPSPFAPSSSNPTDPPPLPGWRTLVRYSLGLDRAPGRVLKYTRLAKN